MNSLVSNALRGTFRSSSYWWWISILNGEITHLFMWYFLPRYIAAFFQLKIFFSVVNAVGMSGFYWIQVPIINYYYLIFHILLDAGTYSHPGRCICSCTSTWDERQDIHWAGTHLLSFQSKGSRIGLTKCAKCASGSQKVAQLEPQRLCVISWLKAFNQSLLSSNLNHHLKIHLFLSKLVYFALQLMF